MEVDSYQITTRRLATYNAVPVGILRAEIPVLQTLVHLKTVSFKLQILTHYGFQNQVRGSGMHF